MRSKAPFIHFSRQHTHACTQCSVYLSNEYNLLFSLNVYHYAPLTVGQEKNAINLSEGIVHGPDRVTVHPPQDSLRPSFYCSLDLPGYQKSMPSKKSWDELPVLGHFQNGRHRNLEITFCAIT